AQRLCPAEVIVAAGDGAAGAVREALSGLADKGIRIVVTAAAGGSGGSGGSSGLGWARSLARRAWSPWVVPWPEPGPSNGSPSNGGTVPGTYLLDLACARECAQADAVGFGPADYEFTLSLAEPALARRDLLAPGGPDAADWGSHGLRLFTITRS
ncbi:MAG: hypothetical protein J2P25_25160, partial [Nocardiopsaceae bacterium]|nr:hypothetical protein [Nocardiopsaceae bacterium]